MARKSLEMLLTITMLLAASTVQARNAFNAESDSNVVVYWVRDPAGYILWLLTLLSIGSRSKSRASERLLRGSVH